MQIGITGRAVRNNVEGKGEWVRRSSDDGKHRVKSGQTRVVSEGDRVVWEEDGERSGLFGAEGRLAATRCAEVEKSIY